MLRSPSIALLVVSTFLLAAFVEAAEDDGADISASKASSGSPSMALPELVERLTNDTYHDFIEDRSRISVVLFYATWHRKSVQLMKTMEDVAEMFAQKEGNNEGEKSEEDKATEDARSAKAPADVVIRFAALHGPHYKKFCQQIGVVTFPILRVVVRGLKQHPYTYTGHSFSAKELYDFIDSIATTDRRQAAASFEVKRQEAMRIPAVVNPTPGLVLSLTTDDYIQYRNSSNILLFVLFYAPWCQHCKGPQETLKFVADYFHRDPTVVIGKFDCEANATFCVETMNIDGYPTFYTVPKPSMAKPGSVYRGGHDSVDIYQHLDIQNQYFEAEGMDEIKQQFEKIRNTPRDQLPEDLSELGGVFAQFKPKKKDEEAPKVLGRKNRGRR
ncbi:thioredoxin-like protein, putative [Bodo saltans]|uniref:Thioredoxin-like protein, putative n=1 Tax=Bodo saltans TaxID=75058 RepID=A0A0S4IKM8_BODSA|nr:thioredoxin-like protein, putative [Bodo saltans]|eukprot:CUE66544.1 thioredoxin-like protein, putative [Bodo saltans]